MRAAVWLRARNREHEQAIVEYEQARRRTIAMLVREAWYTEQLALPIDAPATRTP